MKKVLIIRFSSIGDIVLTTPLLRMFKTTFPECEVDFLTKQKYKEILENNPHVNRILTLTSDNFWTLIKEINRRDYDMIIDLQIDLRSLLMSVFSGYFQRKVYNTRRFKRFLLITFRKNYYKEKKPVSLRFLETVEDLGINDDGKGADFYFSSSEKKLVTDRLKSDDINNTNSLIVLAPGAGRKTKRWPVKRYAEVGKFLIDAGYNVVVIGDKTDKNICDQIAEEFDKIKNYAGEFTLQQVGALLSMAKLLITNDTGVMHIGTAVCQNVIAIFGPTTEILGFYPFRGKATVIEHSLHCRPCSYHGTDTCPQKHFQCMKSISAEEVIVEIRNRL